MEQEQKFIRAKLVILLFLQSSLTKKTSRFIFATIIILRCMMTKYICILVIGWPRPKQLAENLLILKTFNCFAALRRLREFDAKQPFNEEETRGMFYCFFSNWHPIQKKGFPKTAYHLNDCIFQLYTAWRSTILDDYTTKTKDQVSRMSRGFLSYFTKTRENALNRPVYRTQGTVL